MTGVYSTDLLEYLAEMEVVEREGLYASRHFPAAGESGQLAGQEQEKVPGCDAAGRRASARRRGKRRTTRRAIRAIHRAISRR